MHFGSFPLTDEGIDEPLRALERARAAHGVPPEAFRVLDFGATCVIAAASGEPHRSSGDQETKR
jgi:hypothetical protein